MRGSKANFSESLKEAGRATTAGFGRRRLQSTLVVVQVTLALVLLIGAGLALTGNGAATRS